MDKSATHAVLSPYLWSLADGIVATSGPRGARHVDLIMQVYHEATHKTVIMLSARRLGHSGDVRKDHPVPR
jgi:hypothetical protein